MEDQIIYKDDLYEITHHLFVHENTCYALRHLCSVRLEKVEKEFPTLILILSLLLIIVGLLLNIQYSNFIAILGVFGVVGSFLSYFLSRPVHKLYLVFSSGEKEMLEHTGYDKLFNIANAFRQTITS